MQKTVRIKVFGRVQGVGFRIATAQLAQSMNVRGTVENLSDGTVLIYAQADSEVLSEFITKVKQSPSPLGRVSKLETLPAPARDYPDFKINY